MGRRIEIAGRTYYEPKLRWKSGRAYARFYDPERSPKQKGYALHTSDKDAADHLFREVRFEYLHGLRDPWKDKKKPGVTVEDAVAAYLDAQEVRESSRRCKKYRLEPFAKMLPGMLVSGIREEDVRAYCYAQDLKTATQQRYLYEVSQFLEYCKGQGWTSSNVAEDVRRKTPKRKKRAARELVEFLTPQELRSILAKIEEDIEENPKRAGRRVLVDVIQCAALTGFRLGELTNLQWKDVHLYEPPRKTKSGYLYGWLSVRSRKGAETKTGDEARVPVVPQAHALLLRRRNDDEVSGYVFTGPQGGKLQGWWVSDRFRKYRRKAKIREEIHFHSLRHTCASWLADNGADLKVIQEVLRHSNIRQTMRYAHLMPEALADKMVSALGAINLSPAGGNREAAGKANRKEKGPHLQVVALQQPPATGLTGTAYGI